jgi:hypothetical protein
MLDEIRSKAAGEISESNDDVRSEEIQGTIKFA